MHMLVGRDDPHILEIGANDGTDTFTFLEEFPDCRIRCFECDPRAIASWRKRIPDDEERAVLYETALGDVQGELAFHPSGGRPPGKENMHIQSWDKSGSLLAPDQHSKYARWLYFGEPIKVPVTTLDALLGDNVDPIDFAWVDVQGAEAMVLRGAQNTLPRIRWWYCECHSRPYYHGQATLDELLAHMPGFVLHSRHEGDNFLFHNTRV
jgi:FkbM family methyltransferase